MSDGQVSETSEMEPAQGQDGGPGTDDGVPPAADSKHVAQGQPADYSDSREQKLDLHDDRDSSPRS